ncbi:MAG: Ig-like domain-containing protein, partial [Lachnospiraceae bacterium]|nr:Ig-like domain-containing protein [Lachnospiraceae bacterium]
NPLTFADNPGLDMSGLKVGNAYRGRYFHGLVSGGTKSYTYSVDPAYPLPAGLSISQYSSGSIYAYISGTPTEACEKGTARIIVTDSSDPQQEAYIDVDYDEVAVSTPVTGVSLDRNELILNFKDEYTLIPTISPETASIKTVSWSSSDTDIASVNSEGKVKGGKAGKAAVTVTTTQGNMKAACDVYVKEVKPNAEQDGGYLKSLTPDAAYLVEDTACTADENGRIAVNASWVGNTISIVKTNSQFTKCNSDAQELDVHGTISIDTKSSDALLSQTDFTYDGTAKAPTVTISGLNEDDYLVSYTDLQGTTIDAPTNIGRYYVKITGKGQYYGSFTMLFTIKAKTYSVIVNGGTGGGDYEEGKEVTIQASKAPIGMVFDKWTVESGEAALASITSSTTTFTMPANAVEVTAKYKHEHDYVTTITKATTRVNGSVVTMCSFCKDVKSSEFIYYPKTLKLQATYFIYDGGVKTPSVTVMDVKGNTISSENYTVSYASGRKNVGSYKVTVNFKGNYSGSKYTYFYISPKGTSISKVSKAKKAFTVKWKKQSAKMATSTISGYQIRYSISSNMTGAKIKTVKGYKSTSKKITKLKAKKKYYVQIRTYKTVNGKIYYSSWSKIKSVKTK